MILIDSTKYKFLFMSFITLLAMTSVLTSDLYVPAMPKLAEAYSAPYSLVELTVSLYLIGVAIGLLFYGSLSDLYGRKPVLLTGLFIYILGAVGCAFSTNINVVLACRFLQALGGASAIISWQAILNDVYKSSAAIHMATVFSFMSVSPAIAPTIGGFLTSHLGWRSNFFAMAILGVLLFLFMLLSIPESHKPNHKQDSVIKKYMFLLKDKVFLKLILLASCGYGSFYAYVTASPFIFHNMSYLPREIGLFYIPNAIFFLVVSRYANKLVQKGVNLKYLLFTGTGLYILGVLWFIYNCFHQMTVAYHVIIPMIVLFCGNALFVPIAAAKAIVRHPHLVGAAAGLGGFMQMAAGCLASFGITVFSKVPQDSFLIVLCIIGVILVIDSLFLTILKKVPEDKNLDICQITIEK